MLLGKILAQGAMQEDKCVTWIPSYGAEVRGGTAYCMVVISDTPIASPYIDKADTLIAMNGPSLAKFKNRLKNKGLLILNSSLAGGNIDKTDSRQYPFTDLAIKMGNIRVANMVALGCFIAHKNIVSKESIFKVIAETAPPDKKNLIKINRQALEEGMGLK